MARIATHIGVSADFSFDAEPHNLRRSRVAHARARRFLTDPRVAHLTLRKLVPRSLRRRMVHRGLAVEEPTPLDPSIRARLTLRFEGDIRALAELSGHDLAHWLHRDASEIGARS
jgi:hypothetical protein